MNFGLLGREEAGRSIVD